MTDSNPARSSLDRRTVLRGGAALTGALLVPIAASGLTPASAAPPEPRSRFGAPLSRGGRPMIPSGVQAGDVTATGGVIWGRADRASRMWIDIAPQDDPRRRRRLRGPVVTPETDFTGKVRLNGLEAGEALTYRVSFASLEDDTLVGPGVEGTLRTAPGRRRDVRFTWSGDLVGQGWGINPYIGGMRIFETMREADPDFFLCSGDTIYADGPLSDTVTLPDGRLWRNIVIPEKTKVAETLAEYRGQYRYNLMDASLRAFLAQVPQINQWDDHEVTNNWYPGEILDDTRYTEKNVDVLAARARRAFFEWVPITEQRGDEAGRIYRHIPYGPLLDVFKLDMRTYKDANTPGLETESDGGVLGLPQLEWLERELRRSTATWKVIAADLPIGLVVPDGSRDMEGIANRDPGAPRGRELEIARLLAYLQRNDIRNVVWLTADVHYTAAHHYDPSRAAFKDFDPFWEFVSGPLNAGAFGPNALDATFGPEAVFVKAPPRANASPAEGYQFFGQVDIDGGTGAMTVRLRDSDGATLWTTTLVPRRR